MKNGDQITGKVKKLDHGQLYIETPYVVDPIPVDWLQVERVESTAEFQVEMSDGKRMAGTIQKSTLGEGTAGDFSITTPAAGTILVQAVDVVGIQSQKSSVWSQIKGSVGLGFSYDSGSTEAAFNLNASSSYTTTRFMLGADLTSTLNARSDTDTTNRQEISTNSAIFLSHRKFVGNMADFLTSDQQSINLRQTYGGGFGRYFIRTNSAQLYWLWGVVYVKEAYDASAGYSDDQNLEGLLNVGYNWFRFNTTELQTNIQIFPGISDHGRVRTNLNASYMVKFTHDLGLQVNLWDTFDNRPPLNATKNEVGISTSFNYSF